MNPIAAASDALSPAGRRRAGGTQAPAFLALAAAVVAAFVALPIGYLFLRAFGAGAATYADAVLSRITLDLIARTLLLAAGVVGLSLAIALPLAWIVVRSDVPGRRLWALLGALPLVFPSYVAALGLVAVLGPKGHLQGWLEPLGVERLPPIASGYSGALLALALYSYPYVYLLLTAALRKVDPALEESSRSLGCGRWRTFYGAVLPQLRPALYAGSLLIALYTLSDFGAVSITRYNTFTLSIYNAYRGLFDRSVAASLATVLVMLTLLLVLGEGRLVRRCHPGRSRPVRAPRPVPLGRWRWPVLGALAAFFLVTLGIPVGVLGFWGTRALLVGNPLGTLGSSLWGSLLVAIPTALVVTLLAIPVSVWSVRFPGHTATVVSRLTMAGYALPGIVVALALVFLATRATPWLYQTLPLLLAAYVVRFLPEAMASLRAAIAGVSPAFEEAARSLGRTPAGVLRTVTIPLVRPGLLAGAGLVFLTTLKELPATLILRPTGFETLATRIWTAAAEGVFSEAALPGLVLVAASAVPTWVFVIRPVLERR